MSSPARRRDVDLMKLMVSDYTVQLTDDKNDFYVRFPGPKDSPYENGIWKVHVTLPATYPYKSPSIGFCNRMYHPNVDEASGSVCLDVINQTWSPMFDLLNIFSVFLPQLLLYPNPADPLNQEAASLLLQNPSKYKGKIVEYVKKYASKDVCMQEKDDADEGGMDISKSSKSERKSMSNGSDRESSEPSSRRPSELGDEDDDDDVVADDDEQLSDMDDEEGSSSSSSSAMES